MTKSGAEKKRVRRGGGVQNQNGGTRDLNNNNNDTPPRKQAAGKDVFQLFAEKLRNHKEFESRWAVLQETRVEYFRGKDFISFLKNHAELKEVLEPDQSLGADDIVNALLLKNLLVRCDRVVKTLRPGKKKLSSWPAHLEIYPDQVFSENDSFFAWTFVKRQPLWQTILSFVWPVVTLAICLFPVFPHQCKLLVLYSCAGLLLLITSTLTLRCLIFGALWIILGRRVWLFPNILAEETTLSELFQFWPKKDEEERPKWSSRLFYAIVAGVCILLLRHHAPDDAARARYHKRVSNIIDDVLEWNPRLALSGMMETQQANATEPHPTEEFVRTSEEQVSAQPNGRNGISGEDEQVEEEEAPSNVEDVNQHHHNHQ